VVVRNALFPFRAKWSARYLPRCTYTDPEVASFGGNPDKAKAAMPGYIDVFRVDLRHIDRAAAEGTAGFVKVGAWGGELWDATVVGPHAGELIGTISLAMTNGVGLKRIAETVFPYPTYTEALRKVADQYNRTRLTPLAKRLLGGWLRWMR